MGECARKDVSAHSDYDRLHMKILDVPCQLCESAYVVMPAIAPTKHGKTPYKKSIQTCSQKHQIHAHTDA